MGGRNLHGEGRRRDRPEGQGRKGEGVRKNGMGFWIKGEVMFPEGRKKAEMKKGEGFLCKTK